MLLIGQLYIELGLCLPAWLAFISSPHLTHSAKLNAVLLILIWYDAMARIFRAALEAELLIISSFWLLSAFFQAQTLFSI